jgi:hypothetical protein
MRVRVDHRDITWLAVDQTEIAIGVGRQARGVVAKNVSLGERTEKSIAREASGPHGSAYFKRITSEMTGGFRGAATSVYSGEWGPHAGGLPVGAGWRHGVNTDSQKSADIVSPKFRADVSAMVGDLFAARNRIGR